MQSMRHFYTEDYYKRRKFQFDLVYPSLSATARSLVERFDPKIVLDIGCAKGFLVYAFKDLGIEAYGVDISEYATSHSPPEVRDRLFNVDVEHEQLPFGDETFDLVNATEIMEHLMNPKGLLSEIRRVLKAQGVLFTAGLRTSRVSIRTLAGTTDFGRFGSNPTHVNRQPALYWIREFKSSGFNYIGGLSKQAVKEALHLSFPLSRTGRFLMKFGPPGRRLRVELAYAMRKRTMLFRKA